MSYLVERRTVEPHPLAVVRDVATSATLGTKITGSPVWTLVRARGLANGGHNVVVYHPGSNGSFPVEIGVDVLAPFESDDTLICSATPGGEVLTTRHTGPHQTMGAAHQAIRNKLDRDRLPFSGISWEWYGHWTGDAATFTIDIFYLLAANGRPGEDNP